MGDCESLNAARDTALLCRKTEATMHRAHRGGSKGPQRPDWGAMVRYGLIATRDGNTSAENLRIR
jgi:hypothetical protein